MLTLLVGKRISEIYMCIVHMHFFQIHRYKNWEHNSNIFGANFRIYDKLAIGNKYAHCIEIHKFTYFGLYGSWRQSLLQYLNSSMMLPSPGGIW